mgnify:CR=1 FL=1
MQNHLFSYSHTPDRLHHNILSHPNEIVIPCENNLIPPSETGQRATYRRCMNGKELCEQQEYWVNEFLDGIPILDIPLNYIHREDQPVARAVVCKNTGTRLKEKIKELSEYTDTTVYMILLSAIMILLSKYTGNDDIVVGVPIMTGEFCDNGTISKPLFNTLAVRGNPIGGQKYIEFLYAIKAKCIKAYENREYPFEELMNVLGVERIIRGKPILDVLLIMRHNETVLSQLGKMESEYLRFRKRDAKLEFEFYACEHHDGIEISLEFCTARYKQESAQRILTHLIFILEQITENIGVKLEDLEIATMAERNLILGKFNDTKEEGFPDKTITMLFEEQVERTPEAIALVYQEDSITYQQFNARVNQLARQIRKHDVGPDDFVAIIADRSIEMLIGIYGTLKAGGAFVPIDSEYPEARIKFILNDCKPKVILVYHVNIETDIPVIDLAEKDIFVGSTANLVHINNPKDLAYCIYTSGTTGKPKGVMIENVSVINHVKVSVERLLNNDVKSTLLFTSHCYDFTIPMIFVPILHGGTLIILKDIFDLIEYLSNHKVSFLKITPSLYKEISNKADKKFQVKTIVFGGEKLSKEVVQKALFDCYEETVIHNEYGPTETTVFVTETIVDVEHNIIPIGRPVSNIKIYILNKNKLCGIGVPGEICIAGAGLARGYLNQPKLSSEKFVKNPFEEGYMYRSGDWGRWLSDGNIEFITRVDDQVKIRGFRVELGELERTILEMDQVTDAAAIVREDNNGDKSISAYVVSTEKLDISFLRHQLSKILPGYMVPSYIAQIDKLPLMKNGKLDKNALPIVKTNI